MQEGSILSPLRYPGDATYNSWAGGQRQVYTATGNNGTVGYTFEVSPLVEGGNFTLEVLSGATGQEDLDIAMYASLSPVVGTANLFTRRAGGESGFVPLGTRFAIVTMFKGADVDFRFEAFRPPPSKPVAEPALPEAPGIYPDFGKGGGTPLAKRSHVVIAVLDTGINPYHLAFRRPGYAVHPSRYIEGYPQDSPALGLTFGADYTENRRADDGPVWSKVDQQKLYWIPGTNVIGAISFDESLSGGQPAEFEPAPIIDDHRHGTAVASVAAGGGHTVTTQRPYGSNPDALIVVLEGLGDHIDEALEWAASQPWIDFISGSYATGPWNDFVPDGDYPAGYSTTRDYRYTGPFVLRDGRTACFAAANGFTGLGLWYDRDLSLLSTSGPSWVVTVGAVSPRNRQDYGWHNVPVDVSSFGKYWPAADGFSTSGEISFGGTSSSTPVTCGVFSKALLEGRRGMSDFREGIHVLADGTRVPAMGRPATGLLADGVLTRLELQDAVFKTAFPGGFDAERWTYEPLIVPDSPLYYTQEGYGIADVESAARAVDVIFGRAPMPDRTEVDAWIARMDQVRDAIWPPEQYDGD